MRDDQQRLSKSSPASALPYAGLALGAFLCGLLLLGILLGYARTIDVHGLTSSVYYLILLLFGCSVAAFVFGSLRSYARYVGHQLGGTLELGGPAVVLALVVIGGAVFSNSREQFSVTIFVHGQAGQQDIILHDTCSVVLDLGSERRTGRLGDRGQVVFQSIPGIYRGKTVGIGFICADYEPVNPLSKYLLGSEAIYIAIRPKPLIITGRVVDEMGAPVPGATVAIEGSAIVTNGEGWFEETLSPHSLTADLDFTVVAHGFAPLSQQANPRAGSITLILRRGQ
jgi:hypothetical protein